MMFDEAVMEIVNSGDRGKTEYEFGSNLKPIAMHNRAIMRNQQKVLR